MNRFRVNPVRGLTALLAGLGWLAGVGAKADAGPDPIPGRAVTNLSIQAAAGDRILRLGGYYIASAEGPIEAGLGLSLNGVPLDGKRLLGPAEITTPLLEKAYGSVFPRYRESVNAFVFKRDVDAIANNGPWIPFWRPVRYKTNHALPCIQLEVKDLLKAGVNQLVVTNLLGSRFQITDLRVTPAYEPLPDTLLPLPSWIVFSQSKAERALYEKALADGLYQGAEKAELLAALGIADLLAGRNSTAAAARWKEALATAPEFPSRPELLYRAVALWALDKTWVLPEAEIRAALKNAATPDSWAEMARTLLAATDGASTPGPRLVVDPPFSAMPMKSDGFLNEPAWQAARAYPLEHMVGSNAVTAGWGDVRFVFASDRLAIAFTGRLPASNVWVAATTNRDAEVWKDNAVELVLSPDLQFRTYFELDASPHGAVFDGRHEWYWKVDPAWNGDWTATGRIDGDQFVLEYAVPWRTIGLNGPPAPGRWLALNAIRVRVERPEGKPPEITMLSLTPNRVFDTHRLMDGALIRAPAPPPPFINGVAMTNLLARVPPLTHSATGRWPMVTWVPFLETGTNDDFRTGVPLPSGRYRELAERGLTQAIRFNEKFIPMALAIQQAGCKVIVVQGASGFGSGDPGASNRWHRLDPDFKIPKGRPNSCPMLLEGWHLQAMKNRELLRQFKEAGVTLDGYWMDDESQPWGRDEEWQQSRHCSRCRTLFPPGVLDTLDAYRTYVGRLKQDLYSTYLAAPAREAFPACQILNWGIIVSTPEALTPAYWWNVWHGPRTAGLFTALNPVAYGNDLDYSEFWATSWPDPTNTPLDQAHMDRLYTQIMLGQVSRNAENAAKWSPELGNIPWVCRFCPDVGDPAVPELSRPRYREILRHIWLRGADSMQIFNPRRIEWPTVALEEVEDAVSVYDEMLAYREFLDEGTVLNTAIPLAVDEGAIWSGMKRDNRAVIRAFTQGPAPVPFTVRPWAGGPEISLLAPPGGATFLVSADGSSKSVKQSP